MTGEVGEVIALPEGGMVKVFLEELEAEVPVLLEHLELVQPQERKESGLYLAFLPQEVKGEDHPAYHLFLLNTTLEGVLFQLAWNLEGRAMIRKQGQVEAGAAEKWGEMSWDDLNRNPQLDFTCWALKEQGTGGKLERKLRIKPRVFFKNLREAPLLEQDAHLFLLFDRLEPSPVRRGERLDEYTQKNVKVWKGNSDFPYRRWRGVDPVARAEFETKLDLHIEALTDRHRKMSAGEKFRLQVQRFDAYLDEAIRLGVPSVFIIHGVGTGRLREEVHKRLEQNPHVEGFQNNHHPLYGWGATEVFF